MEKHLENVNLREFNIPENIIGIFYVGNFIKIDSRSISTPYGYLRQFLDNGKWVNEKNIIRNAFNN
jgi:hypothetical protein